MPDSLATNDPVQVLEFFNEHDGRIISKRYRTSIIPCADGTHVGYPTSPVSLRDIGYAESVAFAPMLFQVYIPKRVEVRVTIVGDRVFAAEIDSQLTHRTRYDWRNYDWSRTPYRRHELPSSVRASLLALVNRVGLNYATADLIVTLQGEYVFLEINPGGQYLWIETAVGFPITEAICDFLEAADAATDGQRLESGVCS